MIDTAVRTLLATPEIRAVFEADDGQYRLEYGTQVVAVESAPDAPKVRVYQLVDQVRGGEMSSPWGDLDLDKQTEYIANVIRFGRYRLLRVTEGWRAVCPTCGHQTEGEEWRTRPRVCGNPAAKGKKKGHAMDSADVSDRELTPSRVVALGLSAAIAELKLISAPSAGSQMEEMDNGG